jgi:hypothetical protein
MLWYLHCCDPNKDGKNDDSEYDPSYKIMELKNELEKRWSTIFIPGQQLSLDETLLRAFGCMKIQSPNHLEGGKVWHQTLCCYCTHPEKLPDVDILGNFLTGLQKQKQ